MPDQLQLRGGTTVQHSTFTGASKEVTVDTTKKTVVVHDGSTAGGNPVMREDASNSALALGSAGTPSLKFTGDTNTGIYSPGADQVSVATGGTERLRIDSTGQIEAVSLGTAAAPVFSFTGDPDTGVYSPGANQVAISTGGSGRLFVDASGNVGLGTSAPDANSILDARGLIYVGNGTIVNQIGFSVGNSTATLGARSNHGVEFRTNNTERLRITSAGLVGIGTSAPSSILHCANSGTLQATIQNTAASLTTFLSGGSSAGGVGTSTNHPFDFFTNNQFRARIDSSGNVGIGTTSPTDALQVANGNILIGTGGSSAGYRALYFGSSAGASARYAYIEKNNDSPYDFNIVAQSGTTAASTINFKTTSTSTAATIDSSGRLLVGTSSARSNFAGNTSTPLVQIEGVTAATASSSVVRGAADATGPTFNLGKTRGASVGQHTVVASDDQCGVITFQGADGTNLIRAAQISADVDGTPGANDMPGRLVFSTTADGASSPTERMRITNDGRVLLGATTGDSGLVVDRAVSRAALGTTAPGRIYTGASTITDNTTVASGTVAHGTIVSFDNPAIAATNASVTYTRASTLYVDGAPTAGTNVTISNRYGLFVNAGNTALGENVTIGGAVIPASATASLTLINGTIPSASVVNGVSLYAEDVSASSELKVRDEAGNITTLSPHNFSLIPEGPSEEMAWAFYSERDGTKINVDMLKAIRLLEQLTGEQLVYLSEAQ